MLLSLSIRNIVLVDSLEVGFNAGFCVLTGETGAGKSILLDALGLALGKRADARLLRQGETQASVTAEFDISSQKSIIGLLEEQGLPCDGAVLLRRVLYENGKSKAFINDAPVSLGLLQQLGETLVEVHGQHDQKGLLNPSYHSEILDAYGGLGADVAKVSEVFSQWKEAEKVHEELKRKAEKASAEEEYLRHVLGELDNLAPTVGEEERLAEQRTRMRNSEVLLEALRKAEKALTEPVDVAGAVRSAETILERANDKAGGLFSSVIEALDRASVELEEVHTTFSQTAEDVNADPYELEKVEERLFGLREVARKYKRTVDELSEYREDVAKQLGLIESQEEQLEVSATKAKEYFNQYCKYADKLTEKRKKYASNLEARLAEELKPLKMAGTQFKVEILALDESQWSVRGQDQIRFEVSTNPGSPFGPLQKIASGGELSRFMLALKVVLSGIKSVPTLVFDEIDTGIGGAVADAVGRRLAALAEQGQVICVTHLPQVASYGSQHLRVEKHSRAGGTVVSIETLSDKAKKEEIARMLAGAEVTDEARAAARKLMEA